MNEADEWDRKHRARAGDDPGAPDPFVLACLEELDLGNGRLAFDLAAGRGRHTLELARRGYRAIAFDRSADALEQIGASARAARLSVETANADLAAADWSTAHGEPERPALIVVVNYLDRALFAALPTLLAPGGALLLTTFTVDREGDHPSARWCLERGELPRLVEGAEVVRYTERDGRAGLLARFRVSDAPPRA